MNYDNRIARLEATLLPPLEPLRILRVIIDENRYDRDFVQRYCEGFDGFRQHLVSKGYTPEWAEPICGIKAETIARLARESPAANPDRADQTGRAAGRQMADIDRTRD